MEPAECTTLQDVRKIYFYVTTQERSSDRKPC